MKKLYFIILSSILFLSSNTMSGQNINGIWLGDSETNAMFAVDDDETTSTQIFISFSGGNTSVGMYLTYEEANFGKIVIVFGLPGTYLKDGSHVNCTFRSSEFVINVSEYTVTDPELKALMDSNPDMKKYILDEMVKKIQTEDPATIKLVKDFCNQFKNFTIVSATDSKLVLKVKGKTLSFDKAQ